MVKANAYGHGLKEIAHILRCEKVKLGVATIREAKVLRKYFKGEILIVEPIKFFDEICDFQFVVDDYASVNEVVKRGLTEKCYIKINTGMNRFGFKYDDLKTLKKIAKQTNKIKFKGLLTHFSCLDNEEITAIQYQRFCKIRKLFSKNLSVSFGGSNVIDKNFEFDECRVGIGFYGYECENLKPIMEIKSNILKIVTLKDGEGLGYGNSFISQGKSKIGVVGLGYGDGIRRALKGFYVYVKGQRCDILGNICMDCFFVNLTDVEAKVGDEVCLENAEQTANYLNTISYEVLTAYSNLRGEVSIL